MYSHPDFDVWTLDNDIAILHLAEPSPDFIPHLHIADEALMALLEKPGELATVWVGV